MALLFPVPKVTGSPLPNDNLELVPFCLGSAEILFRQYQHGEEGPFLYRSPSPSAFPSLNPSVARLFVQCPWGRDGTSETSPTTELVGLLAARTTPFEKKKKGRKRGRKAKASPGRAGLQHS
jgi:hypothetical protein